MNWPDIYLSRRVPEEQLARTLAQLFDIPVDRILISSECDWGQAFEDSFVTCDVSYHEGDFPMRLWIIPDKRKMPDEPEFNLDIVGRLAEALGCQAMIHADDIDDYVYIWWLIRALGYYEVVEVDYHQLDYHDALVIARTLTESEIEASRADLERTRRMQAEYAAKQAAEAQQGDDTPEE